MQQVEGRRRIVCLRRFRDLLHEQFYALLAGLINLIQMLIQLAGRQQIGVQSRSVLLQISFLHQAILADLLLLRLVNCQIGEKVISDLSVGAAVTFEKGLVCIHRETAAKTRAMMAKEINKTPEFQNDFFYNALAFLDRYFLGEVVEV